MKVLFLPQTCALGPSSRYRVYQLVPLLEQMGIACEVSPGIGTELYEQLYLRGGGSKLAAMRAVWQQRRQDFRRVKNFDAVFIQKGFFPGLHAGIEVAMAKRKPVIFGCRVKAARHWRERCTARRKCNGFCALPPL